MPEDSTWGPVSGQNTVTGHGVLPLTPLKYIIGHTFPNLLSCVTLKVYEIYNTGGVFTSLSNQRPKSSCTHKKTGCSTNAGFYFGI